MNYDVPDGEQRGAHAFRTSKEVIIALSGSFDVVLHNGDEETQHQLNRSYYGFCVPGMTWRYMDNFSTNSLALVLSSIAMIISGIFRTPKRLFPMDLKQISVKHCEVKRIPKVHSQQGNLTAINGEADIPTSMSSIR